TERRTAHLSKGTENFIVIGNLGNSSITNFIVTEDGETYQYIDNWDIDASRAEKTFKNGIVKKKNRYELICGIGYYGTHEYIVEYTITNFIKQLNDSQILFWRFVNDKTNIPPEEVTVEIETYKHLNSENGSIWGFGFPGEINFNKGKITAVNDEPLDKKNY